MLTHSTVHICSANAQAGGRTRVICLEGRDTNHCTTRACNTYQEWCFKVFRNWRTKCETRPEGFEPSTFGLGPHCSIQAELRAHAPVKISPVLKFRFK